MQEPSSAKTNMSRKQTPGDDPLKQILLQIGLFDELYLFFKCLYLIDFNIFYKF